MPARAMWLDGDEAVLEVEYDAGLVDRIRAIPGRRWDPHDRRWFFALTPDRARAVIGLLDLLGEELEIDPEEREALEELEAERDPCRVLFEHTMVDRQTHVSLLCGDEPVRDVPELGRRSIPLTDGVRERRAAPLPARGRRLRPLPTAHLPRRRAGTRQDDRGARRARGRRSVPAVVVCPASLKLNWRREAERWLPARSIQVIGGGRPRAVDADVVVLNYEILEAHRADLVAARPRALVLDEAHYVKNPRAQRTRAAQELSEALAPDALRLALTGTPVLNRPAELVAPLRVLGRLGDIGGSSEGFKRRFAAPEKRARLHEALRSTCFLRRLKAEVLPQLPAKEQTVIPVALTNEREYRSAEEDVIAWLRTQPGDLRELDARVARALRAEQLARLGALRTLAARGKLAAALGWIDDFLASGERLVVFARLREVQAALRARFPGAAHVLGADSLKARHTAVAAFQETDEHQLMVCSLEVAGQGITLTRASHVCFLELDWTPAKHDQAEDRCHRIGQEDAVTAWYLLAADTIDEAMAEVLERKRATIGSVTDGRTADEEGMVDAVVRALREKPRVHLRAAA